MTQEIQSLLGKGSDFDGTLKFDGTVRIDGAFKGRIESSGTLVIGPTGEVEADVVVGTCVLEGSFKGTLKASELVEAHAPARLQGRVETSDIQVERGVVMDGEVVMAAGMGAEKGETGGTGARQGREADSGGNDIGGQKGGDDAEDAV